AAAREHGLAVRIVHAPSFIEPCLALVELDALEGLQGAAGVGVARAHFPALSPDRPVLVGQVFSRLVASEVKLTLLSQYPADHVVLVLDAAGSPQARAEPLPLAELDLLDRLGHTNSVF